MISFDFSSFADLFREPMVLLSEDGTVLDINLAFQKAVDASRDAVLGKNLLYFSATDPDKLKQYLRNCSQSRQMVLGSIDLVASDGETQQYRSDGAVILPAGSGNAATILIRLKDKNQPDTRFLLLNQKIDELNREIFERRRAEEELHELYSKARDANRLKDEFLATVSHELRTPLNAILGWARMLRLNHLEGEQFDSAIETIERNARSQTQLVEDLLDISRMISGKLRLEVRPTDLAGVVRSAVETLRPTADNKGIRLQSVLDPNGVMISGDPERIQQALWNLLSNAIKFTPKNGRVQVRLERINSHVEITVSDTGKGIEPDFLDFVFDRFRQADSSKTRKHGGLGLGLSIARHLVELHGGSLHAFSEGIGCGATFTIKLPLIIVKDENRFPSEAGSRSHPTAFEEIVELDAGGALIGLKVLAVDDEPDARELLRTLLASYGAIVETSSSAADGFSKIDSGNFEFLISDIEMPDQDGYEFIKKVRAADGRHFQNIGAIALTAHARTSDRLKVLAAGFDSHIAKPFEPAELIAVIVSLSNRRMRK